MLGMRTGFCSWTRWLAVHLAAAAMIAPWIARYLDHTPEFLSGPLPIRFLLGTPIGYIGGNFATLAGLVLLIAWGIRRVGPAHQCEAPADGQGPPDQTADRKGHGRELKSGNAAGRDRQHGKQRPHDDGGQSDQCGRTRGHGGVIAR